MAWRDTRQRARVCRILGDLAELPHLWGPGGPSSAAISILEAKGAGLTDSQRGLVLSAWAIWNGQGAATLAELLRCLNRDDLQSLAALLLDIGNGPGAIDEWIAENGHCVADECPHGPASPGQLHCLRHGGEPDLSNRPATPEGLN